MYGHSRSEEVLSASHAKQGNFSLLGFKIKRGSTEDQLAEDRQWGPAVRLHQDLKKLGITASKGLLGLGGFSSLSLETQRKKTQILTQFFLQGVSI